MLALLIGDAIVLALVTLYGFKTHGTLSTAGAHMLTTFLPWLAAWLLVAPHVGVFHSEYLREPRDLWRPFWAMLLASPLGGLLRAVWLGGTVLPVFVAVFGGISALGILLWRALFWLFVVRRRSVDG